MALVSTLNAIDIKDKTYGDPYTNSGDTTASGTNLFNMSFTNEQGATFTNNGKLTFKGTWDNKGTFTNNISGTIELQSGTNTGTLNNKGTITIATNKVLKNYGIINIELSSRFSGGGTITNFGTINSKGAIFSEKVTNESGTLNISGSRITNFMKGLDNKGTINVESGGTIQSTSGELKNESSGVINVKDATFNTQTTSNFGKIFIFGNASFKGLGNKAGGYFEVRNSITFESGVNNSGTLNLVGKSAVLTIKSSSFVNNSDIIFRFADGLGQIVIENGAKFENTDNKGKVQVVLSGLGKATGEYDIIKATNTSNITLKESDVIFVGGMAKYLGNGKVLVDFVFPDIPTGTINTPIIATNKANVASMNSMFLASNAIISGNMYNAKRMANRNDSRPIFALSALKSNESFYYDSKPLLLADARNSAQSQASGTQSTKENFYFLLTPFINYTSFKQTSGMSVSGLDYGFVTAFGGKVNENNTLGAHFVFDYAKLSDKNDSSFSATNTNLMVGLNYRLDLIYEMYLKARGDFYYFMNNANSNATGKASPNNLGGGVNVAFGKDFTYWEQAGVLGVEVGFDYKALSTGKSTTESIFGGTDDGTYDKALYHILYADLGLNYYKYFSTSVGLWGLDAGIGARANLTPKVSSNRLMIGNRSIDISLDNDNFLGYLNIGGSYVLEAQNYDMEFTLRYNGSFGDKTISNGGSFEWRTKW